MTTVAPDTHGLLDYVLVAFLALGPSIFGLEGLPAILCYVFAAGVFSLTLLTDYPLGVTRVVPHRIHRAVEAMLAVLFIGLPWATGFASDRRALWFFFGAGVYLMIEWVVTDPGLTRRRGPTIQQPA